MLTEHFCILFVHNCFVPIRISHADRAAGGVMAREAFLQGPHRLPRLDRVHAVRHAIKGKPLGPCGFGNLYLRLKRFGCGAELVTVGLGGPVKKFHLGLVAGDA
eukprot:13637812-Ditylum_brightwellii.AAC.1